jgi:ATP-dependent helicase/nuclease subunit A
LIACARDEARAREENERLRLLYVALTRAEKWLIVAAAGDVGQDGNSWYQMVEAAMEQSGATFLEQSGIRRLSHGDWEGLPLVSHPEMARPSRELPHIFTQPAGEAKTPAETISPSDLGGAKALPGDVGLDEEAAKLRGTRLHLLLEYLPGAHQTTWAQLCARILPEMPDTERLDLLTEATGVLTANHLQAVFVPDALTEVPVSAALNGARVHGVIDRLIVKDDEVQVIDFKSNASVPDQPENCPEGVLRQMGAYAQALSQIYPGKDIRTAVLWTRTATLMWLPHDLVTQAVARAQVP